MVKFLFSLLLVLPFSSDQPTKTRSTNQIDKVEQKMELIPYPKSIKKEIGKFELTGNFEINAPIELSNEKKYLTNLLTDILITLPANKLEVNSFQTNLVLAIDPTIPDAENAEAYQLKIQANELRIAGSSPIGVMRGIQTLRQLIGTNAYASTKQLAIALPCVTINDAPAFPHRGLLLDVCRHFFDKKVVFKYIDALAYYKMNVLHFHLTEDQGWRIPIAKYPKLTEISAWRTEADGSIYGGSYTTEELKEIVAYASERHITVIPEIELPGHAQAALAAYPHLSCAGGPISVANDWGVFKEIFCAGNDSTFVFLEDVLTEVMAIFPSEYIHIGGDEAPKFRWEHCDKCKKRMTDEGLNDAHELQSYFIKRIEKFLNKNGRKLIGWDEILEGGLSPTATVQSWRGMDGGLEAARTEHEVIMSPTSHCYLDYSLAAIDLQKIYGFNPIPPELEEKFHKYILGGECNIWTEHVPNEQNLDSKVFPRMIALAEVLWSAPKQPNFDDFYNRLQSHYSWLEKQGIAYGMESIGAQIRFEFQEDSIQIHLDKSLSNLTLKYRWSEKDEFQAYTTPIALNRSGILEVQAFKAGKIYGNPIKQTISTHLALNSSVTYSSEFHRWYAGTEKKNLVDGRIGSLDFRDGTWQGFFGRNVEVELDLGKIQSISKIACNFYQYSNSWIFFPSTVEVSVSKDQKKWSETRIFSTNSIDLSNKKRILPVEIQLNEKGKKLPARYIRFKATNIGVVPNGHEAAGQPAWLFIDEIEVK
ncbi:MAG: family 20 glycosylhydrolase [Crocinitomix sp.]|nr:family 20 glycosylhydrolase [Crocinitomix sp.]